MKALLHFSLLMSIAALPTLVFAQWHGATVPDSLSFQGVVDSAGTPLNGDVPMTFKLYKNGTEVWTETQPSVEVVDGVFNVLLGSVTPLGTVAFNEMMELGVTVDGDPEIAPRTPLTAGAFALGMRGMYAVWATSGVSHEGFNIIGGAPNNSMAADVIGGTIGGGGGKEGGNPRPNSVEANWATIGGGGGNTASGGFATVGGGIENTASGSRATVGGGNANTASGSIATVAGGNANTASGSSATVAGGVANVASGSRAAVGGGIDNSAEGPDSTVPGGESNRARGGLSLAAGQRAKADHGGTFVWADSISLIGADFASTGVNQFLIRAGGGVGINTNAPAHPLHVGTDATNGNGAHVTDNGVWTSASSRLFKDGFEEIDKTELLHRLVALPVTKWHYRGDEDVLHIGPTAEAFRDAFGLGHDDRYITTVDADGVALAAIQGLYELIVAQQAEIDALKERLEGRAE